MAEITFTVPDGAVPRLVDATRALLMHDFDLDSSAYTDQEAVKFYTKQLWIKAVQRHETGEARQTVEADVETALDPIT